MAPDWKKARSACGVLGPACFVGGWITAGSLTPGYSPVRQAISQLARSGVPHRVLMTSAFIGFGLAMPIFAKPLEEAVGGGWPLRASVSLAGIATLGVAAFPLTASGGHTRDRLHEICAIAGYVGMAVSPIAAGLALYKSRRLVPAAVSIATGALSAALLSATGLTPDTGLLQRSGLGIVDLWFMVMGVGILIQESKQPARLRATASAVMTP